MSLNPNYNHTITLYHKGEEGWNRSVYEDCFFRSEIRISQSDKEETLINTYTVRIPADKAGVSFVAVKGDVVVNGLCTDLIDDNTKGSRVSEVLARNKPNAFRVTAVADNTGHLRDKHWRLGG